MTIDGRERLILAALVVPMMAIVIASTIADAATPTLLTQHPLVLIAIVPRPRNLVLTAPLTDPVPWFTVAFVRMMLTDPIFFLFGHRYGERAIRWIERHWASPTTVRAVEDWFRRASYVIIFVAPNNLLCALAGASGMTLGVFLVLHAVGSVVQLVLIRLVGDAFADPIRDATDFIGEYRWWFTALTTAIVIVSLWRSRRAGRDRIETVDEVAEELFDDSAGVDAGDDDDPVR
jgi:membrane protein DedA with SNARE-associated domain